VHPAPNPFETPRAATLDNPYVAPSGGDEERIRREHLNHETSIKGIGTLWVVSGVAMLIGGAVIAIGAIAEVGAFTVILGILYTAMGGFAFWVGRGIRRFDKRVRTAAIVLSAVGLLGFPMGTVINGYMMYLLLSRKGEMIFSDQYREIVARTPHVRYRTPIYVWVLVAVFAGLIILAIAAATF
jgi:hypothetical protein